MKKILLLLSLFSQLAMADAVIFSGNDVKALKPNLDLFGVAKIVTVSTIPSTGGGRAAPIGSIALYSVTGDLYLKTGAGNTAWTKNLSGVINLTTDVTGILPVANGGTGVNAFTSGSIVFSNGSILTQDNASLYFDNTNNRLGIGTSSPSGVLDVQGGTSASGAGAPINLIAQNAQAGTSNLGGAITITAGNSTKITSGSSIGGTVNITGGNGAFVSGAAIAARGGPVNITGGLGASTSPGGIVSITGGPGGATSGAGANVNITGGSATSGTAGNAVMSGGVSTEGNGGAIQISAGNGGTATATSRNGGSVSIIAGAGVVNGNGGGVSISAGSGLGSGVGGNLTLNAGSDGTTGAQKYLILQNNAGKVGVGTSTPDTNAVFDIVSTTGALIPPRMTTAQKNLLGNTAGAFVWDSDLGEFSVNNGANWSPIGAGSSGTILPWVTSMAYVVNDVVIESDKIYECLIAHTSGIFATDLANGDWVELSAQGDLTGAVTSVGLATSLGAFSSSNLSTALSDETGTSLAVFSDSPALVTPDLGTPSALVGTNITGTASGLTAGTVTTNANLTGAVTSSGNATSLGSFTSSNLSTALTDETGTGVAVFATSPTLVTPNIGAATATSVNGTSIPSSKTLVVTTDNLSVMAATTSAQLAGVISDETGTGALVFGTAPTITLANGTALPLTTGVTGVLPVANGGTGLATLTAANVIIGNGTSNPTFVAPGTSGNVLASNGSAWVSAAPGFGSGVPAVPGVSSGNVDTFTFSYGTAAASAACSASPCSYLDQIGTAVSSVTRTSSGIYNLNTATTYNKLKCVINSSSATNVAGGPTPVTCASCNTVQFISVNAASGTVIDTYGTGYCQGTR